MKQLEDAIVVAFRKLAAEGKLEEMIEKQLADTINNIIRDMLRSYSDFGKALEKKMSSDLNVDLNKLSFEAFNDAVMKLVAARFNNVMDEGIKKQMNDFLTELLQEPPDEIKLSTLLESLVECHKETAAEEGWEYPTISIKEENGFTRICFDREPNQETYQCEYSVTVYEGKVSNVIIDRKDMEKTVFVGKFYGFDRMMFQLYAAKTNLIIDVGEGEVCYPDPY